MKFVQRQLKYLSAALVFGLFLGSLLLAVHHHSILKNESDANCSICQISHSNTKFVSGSFSFKFVDPKPAFHLPVTDLPAVSSVIAFAFHIRGPPSQA